MNDESILDEEKSDGNHDVRANSEILVNLSFEVGAGIKRTTVRTEPAP